MPARVYYFCAYWVSWTFFGAGSVALNAVCALLLLLPGRERRAPWVREAIRRLFATWVAWLGAAQLVKVTWSGLGEKPLPRQTVYVANHPGLIDATLLLARIPDAICIFKPSLVRNPFLAPAAIMAGYAPGDSGVDLVRGVAGKAAAGCSVLIFPEGTRTEPGAVLNSFKPGFAIIARRAAVPIQLLVIRSDRELLPRNRVWWSVPRFPIRVDIRVDQRLPVASHRQVDDTVQAVERAFYGSLAPTI
jgi:1-acyl-sn-glycerol-3-phosphate acyltransferase